jgi:co-chaperonin GroES (HSP10)
VPISSLNPTVKRLRPIGQKVLVRHHEDETRVDEIFMPENRKYVGLAKGTVLAVGDTVEDIEVGDVAYFARQLGFHRVDMHDGLGLVIPVENILATEPK